MALSGAEPPGHVYLVESTGPFEDDPNVTNKCFPGNPTKSYRRTHPLRIISEVEDWEPSDPELVKGMLENLERMRKQGLQDLIEDDAPSPAGQCTPRPQGLLHTRSNVLGMSCERSESAGHPCWAACIEGLPSGRLLDALVRPTRSDSTCGAP